MKKYNLTFYEKDFCGTSATVYREHPCLILETDDKDEAWLLINNAFHETRIIAVGICIHENNHVRSAMLQDLNTVYSYLYS